MTKYSADLKMTIVTQYLTGNTSYRLLGKKYGIEQSIIRRWIALAKVHGFEALEVRRVKRQFDGQAKFDVLNYKLTNGLSYNQTGAHFDIRPSLIYQWERKYNEGGIDALKAKRGRPNKHMTNPKPQPVNDEDKYKQEILDLKQRLYRAELELAVSKKLEALAIEKQRIKNLHK